MLPGYKGETLNAVTGCNRCSTGCDLCYALVLAGRLKLMGQPKYQKDGDPRTSGPGFGVSLHREVLAKPFRWRKPRLVFANSMSDLWHPEVPDDFIDDVFAMAALAPRHIFQLLTKRSKRLMEWSQYDFLSDTRQHLVAEAARGLSREFLPRPVEWESRSSHQRVIRGIDRLPWPGWPLPNVWLGVSIESDRYTFRADHLRQVEAVIRFLSLEPLVGPLPSLDLTGIHWVIAGGESGKGARPVHPDWLRDIRDRCQAGVRCEDCDGKGAVITEYVGAQSEYARSEWDMDACATCGGAGTRRIPFFFKQWGSYRPMTPEEVPAGGGSPILASREPDDPDRMAMSGCFHAEHQLRAMLEDPRFGWQVPMVRQRKKSDHPELDGRLWREMPDPAIWRQPALVGAGRAS